MEFYTETIIIIRPRNSYVFIRHLCFMGAMIWDLDRKQKDPKLSKE